MRAAKRLARKLNQGFLSCSFWGISHPGWQPRSQGFSLEGGRASHLQGISPGNEVAGLTAIQKDEVLVSPWLGLKKRFLYLLGCLASKAPQQEPLPYHLGYWAQKDMTGDDVLFRIGTSLDEKKSSHDHKSWSWNFWRAPPSRGRGKSIQIVPFRAFLLH